jgi:hypothetical protein
MIDPKKTFEELTPNEIKELKIEFAPGCFDHFEGTQEELDQLIQEIKDMFANGTVQDNSRPVTKDNFDELPEELQMQLARALLDPEDQHLIPSPRNLQ